MLKRWIVRTALVSCGMAIVVTAAAAEHDLRLIEAIKHQDQRTIESLLKAGLDPNITQGDGATALHWAVYRGDLASARSLIAAGARVNAADDTGVTPLALACGEVGRQELVRLLLGGGADPNLASQPTAVTPLMIAARAGAADAVSELIAKGARVNDQETAHDQTALMWAAARRQAEAVAALLKGGADVKARSRAHHELVMRGDRFAGQNNADGISDFDAGGFSALLFAARSGDVASARLLLQAGAAADDESADGTSALTIAAHSGRGEVAALLLEHGANPNAAKSGYTALHAAVLRGDVALARALIAHGADLNIRLVKGTPVSRASKDFAFSDALIGATPYWLAAKFADAAMLDVLHAGGADGGLMTPDGTTPLMVAAGFGLRREIFDRRGRRLDPAEIEAAKLKGDDDRATVSAVKAVLAHGGDINAANRTGDTALHVAVSRGDVAVVTLLADHGANLRAKNKRGQTPLSIAKTPAPVQLDEGSERADGAAAIAALLVQRGVTE